MKPTLIMLMTLVLGGMNAHAEFRLLRLVDGADGTPKFKSNITLKQRIRLDACFESADQRVREQFNKSSESTHACLNSLNDQQVKLFTSALTMTCANTIKREVTMKSMLTPEEFQGVWTEAYGPIYRAYCLDKEMQREALKNIGIDVGNTSAVRERSW